MDKSGQEDRGNEDHGHSTTADRSTGNPLIASHLALLRTELASHPQDADTVAVQLAQMISPSYVNDAIFLQNFLIADKLDVKRAARRVRLHFAKKMELFGLERITTPVSVTNLDPSDLTTYSSGGIKILPEKDKDGQSMFLMRYGILKFSEHRNVSRSLWVMLMSALTSGQIGSGIVWISVDDDIEGKLDRSVFPAIAACLASLPLRVSVLHSLTRQEDEQQDSLIEALSNSNQVEAKVHVGNSTDWIYGLARTGITTQYLASLLLDMDGNDSSSLGLGNSQQGTKRKAEGKLVDTQANSKGLRLDDDLSQSLSSVQQSSRASSSGISSSAAAAAAAATATMGEHGNSSSMNTSTAIQDSEESGDPQGIIISLLKALATTTSQAPGTTMATSQAASAQQSSGNSLNISTSQQSQGRNNMDVPAPATMTTSQLAGQQQNDMINNQLRSFLGRAPQNSGFGGSSTNVPNQNSLASALTEQLNILGSSLSELQDRNLEAAILGAQMLINNPEAAARVLLGGANSTNSQSQQGMQGQGIDTSIREDNFAASRRILSEQRGQLEAGVGSSIGVQHLSSSADGSVTNSATSSHSEFHNLSKSSVDNAAASAPSQQGSRGNTRVPVLLYCQNDDTTLSRYQCLVRQQIEMFEATEDDVQFNISRMSKIIVLGQVGIRCRHCAVLPQYSRPKAAVYYPRTLDSMYQFGQNMVKNHLCASCELIPSETKNLLIALQEARKRGRGGRDRWAQAAHEMGVIEDENGLRFK